MALKNSNVSLYEPDKLYDAVSAKLFLQASGRPPILSPMQRTRCRNVTVEPRAAVCRVHDGLAQTRLAPLVCQGAVRNAAKDMLMWAMMRHLGNPYLPGWKARRNPL